MQDAYAVNHIKAFGRKGQGENGRLERRKRAISHVLRGPLCRGAEIDAYYGSAPASRHFCKAAHAAADVEYKFSLKFFPPESGLHLKMTFRFADLIMVELGLLITVPLKTATGSEFWGTQEAHHPCCVRVRSR